MCHFYLPFHIVWYLHECLWMCRVSHSFWSTMSSSFLYCFVQQHSIWLTITWLSIACLCANIASIHCRKHAKIYSYVHNIQNICNTFCVCVCELLLVSIRTSKCHPEVIFIGDIPALANTHLFNTHKMWSCCSTNIRKLFRMSSQRISGTFP